MVSSGTYSNNQSCTWRLLLPTESSVSLFWEYMNMEDCDVHCIYDWVTVYDVTNSRDVYG